MRLAALVPLLALLAAPAGGDEAAATGFDVWPGDDIQEALELAAADPLRKTVTVHEGTYRPSREGQALVFFNARHDGVRLQAQGRVVLTAANPALADPRAPSYPAVVNHVVYFGDGVTADTVLRGFEITGANGFMTREEGELAVDRSFEDEPALRRALFFYSDGGAIKIFGRSYPTLERLFIHDNYTSPCGGGVSIEHRGFNQRAVTLRDSVLSGNRAQITGSAVDLLPGSSASIENCLFTANISNLGDDTISVEGEEYMAERGSGALTVFRGSRVVVVRSTFTGNANGVDDASSGNAYLDSVFWRNDAPGGVVRGARYELLAADGSGVSGCLIGGAENDPLGTIDPERNTLGAPDPRFDADWVPRSPEYSEAGYRPPEEP